ncbi:MAG: 50S ribosomal protein L25 [Firmicutes bacterium HGW-Firmicutes-2]|jgi:large subunit ribosomal protein L25|nr:MAG: 50S ribosomal protein L25 [Firmicutes bacterium HGW-Firmicutes-2]
MEEIIIEALERPKKSGKFKEQGFVPGVLYGEGIEATTSVKFDALIVRKLISHHGSNAKVWVQYKGSKKFGFVKEVQFDPLSRRLLHIDVQMVAKDQKIQLHVPIHFINEDSLKVNQLEFQIYKHEVTVTGDMTLMPEAIEVDVSTLALGDQITYADFKLEESLVTDDLELIYGVVNHLKVLEVEEPETDADGAATVEPALVGEEEE